MHPVIPCAICDNCLAPTGPCPYGEIPSNRVDTASMSSIPDNNSQDASIDAHNGKVLLAAVICLSIVIFFVLLLHGYARWVLRRRPIVANVVMEPLHRRSLSTYPGYTTEMELPGNGLDAKVVASLPKFVYRSKEHENGLHCVVCLSVMVEDEIGRLLPKCKHTFHVECIDMWLMSHSTCPICRAPVKTDEPASVGSDGAPLVVLVEVEVEVAEEERGSVNDHELSDLSGTVEGEVVVEMPIISSDGSSNSSSSSSSSSASTSSSSSVGCSLKRMLSRSRSESRVFPSLPVN